MRVGRDERIHRPGTVLGKALEALPSGKREIRVLLMLHLDHWDHFHIRLKQHPS